MKRSAHHTNTGSRLRVAALIRVSTERQEKEGESLRTQRSDLLADAALLGGTVVCSYGGQEHATEGFEKREIDRLLADAARGVFDAVIVHHADRWSRQNEQSQNGLRVLRDNGVRFFIRTDEQDLFDENDRLYLGMSAVIGEYHALRQAKASMQNRINRAKRAIPTCGKLPFGRTFTEKDGWGIDAEKKATIEGAAHRYLSGDSLPVIARDLRMNHSNLHKILTKRCGTTWEQRFVSKRLNIDETVCTSIPPLLEEDVIRKILARVEGNKTYYHGHKKNRYLFGRVIFCAHCGYAMCGQTNRQEHQYYRHLHTERERVCTGPAGKSWVPARQLETMVMRQLFEACGNPRAVQRAIEEATPNLERLKELRAREQRIKGSLARCNASTHNLVRKIAAGKLSDEESDEVLAELRDEKARLETELGGVEAQIGGTPTPEAVKAAAQRIATAFRALDGRVLTSAKIVAQKRMAVTRFDLMTWEDQRALVEQVFNGKFYGSDGQPKRMGIYIEWLPEQAGKRALWRYTLHGHFVENEGGIVRGLPASRSSASSVRYAQSSRGKAPRARRSR